MDVKHRHNKAINREQWDSLVQESPQGSVPALSGFLDIVHPEWEALIAEEGGHIIAVFPIFTKQKWGIRYALQPLTGQRQGILFGELGSNKSSQVYNKKRQIVTAFAEALQKRVYLFSQNFSPNFDYPLPFYWNDFELFTRYTYHLPLNGSNDETFGGFEHTHKRQIRKAIKRGVHLAEHSTPETFLSITESSLAKHKELLAPGLVKTREQLTHWALQTGYGFLLTLHQNDEPVASGLFLQLGNTTYFFMGHATHEAKQSGAMYLLVWEALKSINGKGHVFDFEGSMIQSIERFFQGFGPQPVPYLHIHKNQLPLRTLWQMLGY